MVIEFTYNTRGRTHHLYVGLADTVNGLFLDEATHSGAALDVFTTYQAIASVVVASYDIEYSDLEKAAPVPEYPQYLRVFTRDNTTLSERHLCTRGSCARLRQGRNRIVLTYPYARISTPVGVALTLTSAGHRYTMVTRSKF